MNRTALIWGVTGQDGSYLAEHLLGLGYRVVGVRRRTSSGGGDERVRHLYEHHMFKVVSGDVTDSQRVLDITHRAKPDEVYNLAAQSHVGTSFHEPAYTWATVAQGTLNILEACRDINIGIRIYQASSSEMFGAAFSYEIETERGVVVCHSTPGEKREDGWCFQSEETVMRPNSPYAAAKLAAHNLCRIYRDSYGMFISCGILFNHESPRRGENFVTKKIARYVARLRKQPLLPPLRLGNIEAKRDWGHARDYVCAMWTMLQQTKSDDFVVATGNTHSVAEFLHEAFKVAEVGPVEKHVEVNVPEFTRPNEVPFLRGNAAKAKHFLGWRPQRSFEQLVSEMVLSEMDNLR